MSNRPTTYHPAMAYALAADPGTTPHRLHRLASHPLTLVRGLVARHARATARTLLVLAHERTPAIHRALLTRTRIPNQALTHLLRSYTRPTAARAFPDLLTSLATHRHLRGQDLALIYQAIQSSPSPAVRLALARHPATPSIVLTRLADTPTPSLVTALINNRATPGPIRLHLQLTAHTAED